MNTKENKKEVKKEREGKKMKDTRLKALQELKEEFYTNNKHRAWHELHGLLAMDYIPNDMDVYEVKNTNYYKSMIDGWTSHTEEEKHYSFHAEMIKYIDGKVATEWVKIEHRKKDLLLKLHEILN